MKNALIDADGVLLAHGFVEFSADSGQKIIEVDDTFNLNPKAVRWDGKAWVDYAGPTEPRTLSDGELGAVLVKKGLLTQAEITSSE